MGNAVTCFGKGSVVKVMLPDATIETYNHAMQVAEMVSMYPNYAVVHCSTAKPSLGQFRAVSIMKMDEFLVPGQAYILYRIPKSFNDSLHVSATDSESRPDHSSVLTTGGEMKSEKRSGGLEGRAAAEELEKTLSQCLMGPAKGRTLPSEDICLLDLEEEERAKKEKTEKTQKKVEADLALEPSVWTPDLYQISED